MVIILERLNQRKITKEDVQMIMKAKNILKERCFHLQIVRQRITELQEIFPWLKEEEEGVEIAMLSYQISEFVAYLRAMGVSDKELLELGAGKEFLRK